MIRQMTDRAITDLCPALQAIYAQWLENCKAAGLQVGAIVTWRSAADQNKAKECGLSNAAAGQSPHNCCDADGNPAARAFDFGVFEGAVYITDGEDARYGQAAQIAKDLGLVWGGDWISLKDYDHLELANWKTLDLQ